MDELAPDDEHDQLTPADALERARRAERSTLPQLRTDIEWATTSAPNSAALGLALGIVYIRLGDLESAATTLAQAEQRLGDKDVELAIEIASALDWCRGPRTYKGPGTIRRAPNSRVFVELPDARYRWASFGLGELVDAGVIPWDGAAVKVQANLTERGWTVSRFAPADGPARGALAKDGKTLRFGELAYLTLRDPCPPEHLHWHLSSWRAAAQELPFSYRDRKVDIRWDRLGIASWAALAEHHATRVLADGGKLTKAGKGLVVEGRVLELVEADQCPPSLRRARHSRWKDIVESIPFTLVESGGETGPATSRAQIDWAQLSTRHAIEPAVASWSDLAAQFGA
ncbi:MAG: hypothetical protein H0T79_12425, partial [Deltaproteobacteria bacterium]|nr:hypothetical protein [Deltaproteobacteria bacterium]